MKKVKILHVTQATIGGTVTYIVGLINNLDKTKFENIVICPKYGDLDEKLKNIGVKVYNIEMEREISVFNDAKNLFLLVKYIKKLKPDLIYLHSSKAGALGRVASCLTGVPCIYNSHGWAFDMKISKSKRIIYTFIERMLSNFTNKIINISKHDMDIALKYKISNNKKMVLVENAIDTNFYKDVETIRVNKLEIKRVYNIPDNKKVIAMLARLSKQKNPQKFLSICESLNQIRSDLYFILIGDGELREEIEELIKYKNINNIKITGWCDSNKIKNYLAICDIGLLTSDWEGFGLTILEYMVSKVAVVASKVGGIKYIIKDGFDGYLADDVNEFVNKVNLLLDNEDLREEIVNNAYHKVLVKYDIKRLINQHQDIFYEVISNK